MMIEKAKQLGFKKDYGDFYVNNEFEYDLNVHYNALLKKWVLFISELPIDLIDEVHLEKIVKALLNK